MKPEYDFSQAVKNPYAAQLKKSVPIVGLDDDSLAYFQNLAQETGIPYQALINSFLQDCARQHKKPKIQWDN